MLPPSLVEKISHVLYVLSSLLLEAELAFTAMARVT